MEQCYWVFLEEGDAVATEVELIETKYCHGDPAYHIIKVGDIIYEFHGILYPQYPGIRGGWFVPQ